MSTTRSIGNKEEASLVLLVDASGNALVTANGSIVTGNVAAGAADSGNPIKVGGKYSAVEPTLADGQRGDMSLDANGRQRVTVGKTVLLASTPTLTVAGAYATGDYIGPTTTPASFTNAVRLSGAAAAIRSLAIVDKQVTAAVALELWLFSATFTAPTDNAAWDISDADALLGLGVIAIPTTKWYASASNKLYSDDTLNLTIKPGVTTLFYALVSRGATPTWVSGDLQLSLGVFQD
jgi:hypothetical protein